MRILAGDVGGTKTILAMYEEQPGNRYRELRSERFRSADYPDLAPMIGDFLQDGETVDRAGIGVAGPVVDDTCKATNLPWELDARHLEGQLGIPRIRLVNDFAAVALGVRALSPDELEVLQEGSVDPDGPVVVAGAGTGLGEAILIPQTSGDRVLATEGGHTDFAPRDEREVALLRFLWERHRGRVSVERVVSGPGLAALYDFLVAEGLAETSEEIRRRVREEDAGKVIGDAAIEGSDPACVEAVRMFVSAYGAEVGNLALTLLPTGGVYLAGGIAPRLIDRFREGTFLRAFRDKGRMSPLLDDLRVCVIMNTRVGLLGARVAATR